MGRFAARDEWIMQKEIAQRQLGGFGDPDPGTFRDVTRATAIVTDPEATGRRGEIQTVVASARNAEGFREPAGAAGESGKIAGTLQLNFPGTRHCSSARQRLQGAEKDASSLSLGFAGDVEAVVVAVNEINIGVTGRAEQYGIAQSPAGGGVSRRIVEAEVSFDFHDAGSEFGGAGFAEQDLAEKLSRYPAGIAGEEGTIERLDSGEASGLRARHSGNGTRGGSDLERFGFGEGHFARAPERLKPSERRVAPASAEAMRRPQTRLHTSHSIHFWQPRPRSRVPSILRLASGPGLG